MHARALDSGLLLATAAAACSSSSPSGRRDTFSPRCCRMSCARTYEGGLSAHISVYITGLLLLEERLMGGPLQQQRMPAGGRAAEKTAADKGIASGWMVCFYSDACTT